MNALETTLKQLHLSGLCQTLSVRLQEAAANRLSHAEFLELILLEMKNARMVESVRGAKGGYQLRRSPTDIRLSEIVRLIDGPLAPLSCAAKSSSFAFSALVRSALSKPKFTVASAICL